MGGLQVPGLLALGAALAGGPIPDLISRVTDGAAVLGEAQKVALETKLTAYEQRTGHQFAVLTIASLEGDALEDFSMRVAEKWRLGDSKRDDGLLVLVAVGDRKARIEVGHGLEGAVTDARSKRVIDEFMIPHFKRQDYSAGLTAGLQALMAMAQGEAVGKPAAPPAATSSRKWVVPALVLLAFFISASGRRRRRRLGFPFFFPLPMGGGWSAGGRGGGGFSGGGGSFGGGGASGSW